MRAWKSGRPEHTSTTRSRNSAPVCHLLYLADDANQDGDAARDRLEIWRVALAPEGSRFDFRLSPTSTPTSTADAHSASDAVATAPSPDCWVEVKSVTLCEGGRARFPDAVTERGRRHLEHLVAREPVARRVADRGEIGA